MNFCFFWFKPKEKAQPARRQECCIKIPSQAEDDDFRTVFTIRLANLKILTLNNFTWSELTTDSSIILSLAIFDPTETNGTSKKIPDNFHYRGFKKS